MNLNIKHALTHSFYLHIRANFYSISGGIWRVYIPCKPFMGAKLSVLGLIMSFSPYPRSVMVEDTARYAGLLLAPAEGFGLPPRLFLPLQKVQKIQKLSKMIKKSENPKKSQKNSKINFFLKKI